MPNRPYTIDGMPESVSVARRTSRTRRLPFFAYSTRYTAAPTPSGTASSSAIAVIVQVFTMAGSIDWFSLV